MSCRSAELERNTKETQISLKLCLDGKGKADININCGFLKHMLELFTAHGRFDLEICAEGDTYVDYHHLTEDLGIALGTAFRNALGDGAGITRYGQCLLPMDETLMLCAVDICGRSTLVYKLEGLPERVGDFDCELAKEFFLGFTRAFGISLHCHMQCGENAHHILEALFKSAARALRTAVSLDLSLDGAVPSTKGLLL